MVAQHVTVSGINMELGEALVEHVQTQMAILSDKYFGQLVTCRIAFRKNPKGHCFGCRIQVVVGRDMHYAGEAEYDDVHICFKQAHEHLAKQLRRQKRARHEDKPNGHMKERVFDELSRPDMQADDGIVRLPIDGEELSILDGVSASSVVEKLYDP